jgi:hypothetical protein
LSSGNFFSPAISQPIVNIAPKMSEFWGQTDPRPDTKLKRMTQTGPKPGRVLAAPPRIPVLCYCMSGVM